jgi:hypothetical protein
MDQLARHFQGLKLATNTGFGIRQIQGKIANRASLGIVGEITKRIRAAQTWTL